VGIRSRAAGTAGSEVLWTAGSEIVLTVGSEVVWTVGSDAVNPTVYLQFFSSEYMMVMNFCCTGV
jgi:hypothetical protein